MEQFLALAGFFVVAIVIMGGALTFAKYKKEGKSSGCCGGGHCSVDRGHHHDHGTAHTCSNHK